MKTAAAYMSMFREQLNTISTWFEQWNECEQTVALYSLLKRLSPSQAHFLAIALTHSIADCTHLRDLDVQANNPAFIASLSNENKEFILKQLLTHLPLLRPGNVEAKTRYLSLIPSVLGHSVDTGASVEESRQLLSYSLIHPAISSEERRSLAYWLPRLEERIANGGSPKHGTTWLHPSSPPHLGFPVNGRQQPFRGQHHLLPQGCTSGPSTSPPSTQGTSLGPAFSNGYHPRVRRSNSLTPPVSIPNSADLWSSQDDLCGPGGRQKARSFSLSSEHAPLSPQSSLASSGSGSESHLDDYRAAGSAVVAGTTKASTGCCINKEQDSTIMRDVAAWLKSLRLHKYASLFARLSYEEMLSLTEERLAAEGVTKGARHKIVLSIRKLKDRAATLKYLGEEVSRGKSIRYALEELKSIACTPMKLCESKEGEKTEGNEDADIPQLFTQVMGKVCAQLLLVSGCSERGREDAAVVLEAGSSRGAIGESAWLFVSLAERCTVHSAFSQDMKQRLTSWKLQVQESCRPLIPPRQAPRPNSSSSSSVTCCTTASTTSSAIPCELRHLNTRSKWNHQFGTLHSDFPMAVGGCRPRFCQRSCTNGAKTPFNLLSKGGASSQHLISTAPQLQLSTSSASNSSSSSSPSSSSPLPSVTRLVNATISEVGPHVGNPQQFTASSVFLSKRPSLQDSLLTEPSSQNHASLHRTKSAPPKPNYFCAGSNGNKVDEESCVGFGLTALGGSPAGHDSSSIGATDPEINSRLESLCLSMTEHALGGVGGI